ncbi:ANTAR domain-containing protein [Streptomyces aureocirculatus]|uniref:ANTAR domain-containing protein n=1 Tax=Streptomyces aureocirculatus TaxID=67275 RepID=UPI0004C7C7BC|nr:ANTAR domain-containing protein [Streptomyces aureocirculatus]
MANALTAALMEGSPQRDTFPAGDDGSFFYRAAVHQAAGVVSAQAGVSLAQALLRLRAHAFRHGCSVVDVAEDVVSRRRSFRHDEDEPDTAAGEGT